MNRDDYAAHAALEAVSRAGKILPVLDSWLEIEEAPPLTETQRIALATTILQVFDGLEETLRRMGRVQDVFDAIRQRAEAHPCGGSLGDAVEQWLASREPDGGLQ